MSQSGKQVRPEQVRPEQVRPEWVRPEWVRPEWASQNRGWPAERKERFNRPELNWVEVASGYE